MPGENADLARPLSSWLADRSYGHNLFRQRTLTALVLLPLVGLMVWLGDWPFTIFMAVVLGIAVFEWCRMFKSRGFAPPPALPIAVTGLFTCTVGWGKQIWLPIISIAALFAILLQAILRYEQKHDSAPVEFLINLGGVLYIGGLGLHFLFVRELPSGGLWFLFFVMVTAVGDTGAYLIGQRWGKHKMGNRVSPNKSWEGYLAGIVTAGLVGLVFAIVAGNWFPLDVLEGTAFAVALYIVIPIGDFGISLFKRWAGVKNTGNLLPGHGGILDRIDTHLWTMTMGYYILKFLVFAG